MKELEEEEGGKRGGEGGSAPVIERADLTRLEPPVDAVEVESVLHWISSRTCQLGRVSFDSLVASRSRRSV